MNKLFLYSTIACLTAASATTGLAKDKDDKKKDKNKDKDHVVYVERDGRRYNNDRERFEERDRDNRVEYRGNGRDRTRTIYVIERNRPVEQVVFVDSDGRYYRSVDGRRVDIRERYFESYPSKYYYPDGRRRVMITLPF